MSIDDKKSFIQRCPHDRKNPYTMVNRELIRDDSISPECRWILIYLLSMTDDWEIRVEDLWNRHSKHLGRDKIRNLIKEAINAGYMRKEIMRDDNKISGVKYYVSEFKKCLQEPGFEAPENEAPENHTQRNSIEKEVANKEYPPLPPPKYDPTKEEEEEIEKRFKERPKGSKRVASRKAWNSKVLEEMRKESSSSKESKERALKHKLEASHYDLKRINGMNVNCSEDYVELTLGHYRKEVAYDINDEEWYKQTGFPKR